jgi:hypothetical protein
MMLITSSFVMKININTRANDSIYFNKKIEGLLETRDTVSCENVCKSSCHHSQHNGNPNRHTGELIKHTQGPLLLRLPT